MLTPVSPAVRYSIEVDELTTGVPAVRVNGASADVAVSGVAVLPPGRGTVRLGDITAVDIQVQLCCRIRGLSYRNSYTRKLLFLEFGPVRP